MKVSIDSRLAALELLLSDRPEFHVIDAAAEGVTPEVASARYEAQTPAQKRAKVVVIINDPMEHVR